MYEKNGYANNHYDECYLIMKDIDISQLKLQKDEFNTEENIINMYDMIECNRKTKYMSKYYE